MQVALVLGGAEPRLLVKRHSRTLGHARDPYSGRGERAVVDVLLARLAQCPGGGPGGPRISRPFRFPIAMSCSMSG